MKNNEISTTRRNFIKILGLGAFSIIFLAGFKKPKSNKINNIKELEERLSNMQYIPLGEPDETGYFIVPKIAIRHKSKSKGKDVFKRVVKEDRVFISNVPVKMKNENKKSYVMPTHLDGTHSIKAGDQIFLDKNNFDQIWDVKNNKKLPPIHRELNRELNRLLKQFESEYR